MFFWLSVIEKLENEMHLNKWIETNNKPLNRKKRNMWRHIKNASIIVSMINCILIPQSVLQKNIRRLISKVFLYLYFIFLCVIFCRCKVSLLYVAWWNESTIKCNKTKQKQNKKPHTKNKKQVVNEWIKLFMILLMFSKKTH